MGLYDTWPPNLASPTMWQTVSTKSLPSPPSSAVYKLLADGASVDLNVNGSGTAAEYEYTVAADKMLWISRFCIIGINAGITLKNFIGLSALSTGLGIELIDTDTTTVLIDFTDGQNVKKGTDFALLAGPDVPTISAAGDDIYIVRWTISKSGDPIYLTAGQVVRVTVQDDLSGITEFRWMLQGRLYDATDFKLRA